VNQEWVYPGGKRRVFLTDGVVTRIDEGAGATEAPAK
jgi:hypothetical protein